jgi:hypothetical protein
MNAHQEKAGGTLMFCGMEHLFAAGIQDVFWKFSKGKFEVRGESSKYEVRGFFESRRGLGNPFPALCDGTPDAMRCASYGIFYFKDDIVT